MRHSSNIAKSARKGAHQVRAAARDMKHSARNHAGSIATTFQRMGSETVEAVKEGVEDLGEKMSDYVKQGRAKVQSFEGMLSQTICERPMTAALTALGIGFVFGRFYSRR
jgi:ElaB/YqjD/DUF883 family membrane-anchored ribosome-binding protein